MLTDETMRKEVCPSLTSAQIGKILSNYETDEYVFIEAGSLIHDRYDKQKVPQNLLKSMKDDSVDLKVSTPINIFQYTNLATMKQETGSLFDIPSLTEQHNNTLLQIKVPRRFWEKEGLEFLNV